MRPPKPFRVTLNLDFDEEQAFASIHARIDRDSKKQALHLEYQHFYLRFYSNILAWEDNMECSVVEDLKDLPKGLRNNAEFSKAVQNKTAYKIRFSWGRSHVYCPKS